MEKKANFIILGVFVVGLFLALIGMVLWLHDYSDKSSFKYFQINTKGSVSGLNIQAPVKFRGVSVGEVRDIFINPENSEEVSILIRVKPSTPIKEDTYSILEPQGITGLSYLQLDGGSNESKDLETSEDKYGIIPSKPSLFSQVNSSFSIISKRTEEVLISTDKVMKKVDKILSDENLKNVESILKNSAKLSNSVANLAQNIQNQQKRIENIMKKALILEQTATNTAIEIGQMSNKVSEVVSENGVKAMDKISTAADSVRTLMNNVQNKVDKGMFDIEGTAKSMVEPINESLNQLNMLFIKMGSLVEQFEKSPSDILYKYSTQKPGPGEE